MGEKFGLSHTCKVEITTPKVLESKIVQHHSLPIVGSTFTSTGSPTAQRVGAAVLSEAGGEVLFFWGTFHGTFAWTEVLKKYSLGGGSTGAQYHEIQKYCLFRRTLFPSSIRLIQWHGDPSAVPKAMWPWPIRFFSLTNAGQCFPGAAEEIKTSMATMEHTILNLAYGSAMSTSGGTWHRTYVWTWVCVSMYFLYFRHCHVYVLFSWNTYILFRFFTSSLL